MAPSNLQVITEQVVQESLHGRFGHRVQSVAAEVASDPVDRDGSSHAAHVVGGFDDRDRLTPAGERVGHCQTGWPGADDDGAQDVTGVASRSRGAKSFTTLALPVADSV